MSYHAPNPLTVRQAYQFGIGATLSITKGGPIAVWRTGGKDLSDYTVEPSGPNETTIGIILLVRRQAAGTVKLSTQEFIILPVR